jgi:WD40 repeat protein
LAPPLVVLLSGPPHILRNDPCNSRPLAQHRDIHFTHLRTLSLAEGEVVKPIWTDGDYLRFAAVEKPGSIAVWQVPFNSADASPAQVESLPIPEKIPRVDEMVFLPSRSRLAFSLEGEVFIWDVKASKFVLNLKSNGHQTFSSHLDPSDGNAFSSDGCFFTCTYNSSDVRVFGKESPDGYLLHQGFELGGKSFLSSNG